MKVQLVLLALLELKDPQETPEVRVLLDLLVLLEKRVLQVPQDLRECVEHLVQMV
jgi:HEPN domain-containing protein